MGAAREHDAAIRHPFDGGSVPLEHRKDRREIAKKWRGRTSGAESDFTYADFRNVHLFDHSAERVCQQLMSQADTEKRFFSFAYP